MQIHTLLLKASVISVLPTDTAHVQLGGLWASLRSVFSSENEGQEPDFLYIQTDSYWY